MNDKVTDMTSKTKPQISQESAAAQVELIFDHYDICPDDFPKSVSAALESSRKKLVRAVMEGRLEVSVDDGIEIVQHVDGELLKYAEVSGASKAEMDKAGDGDNYTKIYCLAGSLTGLGAGGIKKLKGKHIGLVESLGTLFLQI